MPAILSPERNEGQTMTRILSNAQIMEYALQISAAEARCEDKLRTSFLKLVQEIKEAEDWLLEVKPGHQVVTVNSDQSVEIRIQRDE